MGKSEIFRLYSIVHVAVETTKTLNFTCHLKFFISIFFTCQVSSCELQLFSCHYLANDTYSQTAKTVFSHLKPSAASTKESLKDARGKKKQKRGEQEGAGIFFCSFACASRFSSLAVKVTVKEQSACYLTAK